MKSSDVGKRIVVFESDRDKGKTLTILEVYDDFNFRAVTDYNIEYEFCTKLVNVKFVGES